MRLSSSAFTHEAMIPARFTCQGEDINPPLSITEIPEKTKTLALTFKDPDAPAKTWIHWVVYDIPVTTRIAEDAVPGKQGANDFGKQNYGGPCPPSGTHRYIFDLYALDTALDLPEGITCRELENAMEGHILDSARYIGLYQKK